MATWDYTRRLSSVAPAPRPAPAKALPPVTLTPGPGTGMNLRPDPANPYPVDPALPPDARMLTLALALVGTLALAGCTTDPYAAQHAAWAAAHPQPAPPPNPQEHDALTVIAGIVGAILQGALRP